MLADGYLERGKPSYNTRLRIDHSYPEQESYVLGLRILFVSLIASEPVIIVRKADTRTGKVYKSISVRTLRFPCLNKYHDLFYKDKKKIVPLNIQDLLTPIGLAHSLAKQSGSRLLLLKIERSGSNQTSVRFSASFMHARKRPLLANNSSFG